VAQAPASPHPPTPLLLPGGGGPDRRAALGVVTLVVVALALVRAAVATLPADFLPPIRAIRQTSYGQTLTACAELADGNATCWGYSQYGATGRPCNSIVDSVCAPDEVLSLGTGRTVKQLDLGGGHGCAVLDNSNLKCWGFNGFFQLARDNATETDYTIGDDVDEMGDALPVVKRSGVALDVVQVATGIKHTCALLTDETVSCWGGSFYGQVGIGTYNSTLSDVVEPSAPVQLGAGFMPASIVSGFDSTYVVSTSGAVKAWGRNSDGQLGIGDVDNRGDGDNNGNNDMGDNLPAIEFPAGVEAIVSVAPGENHGERGHGWATGQLGGRVFGLPLSSQAPFPPTPQNQHAACANDSFGAVYCWRAGEPRWCRHS